jgi:hypothetical protein
MNKNEKRRNHVTAWLGRRMGLDPSPRPGRPIPVPQFPCNDGSRPILRLPTREATGGPCARAFARPTRRRSALPASWHCALAHGLRIDDVGALLARNRRSRPGCAPDANGGTSHPCAHSSSSPCSSPHKQ